MQLTHEVDVLVVGAGQAGLAMGYHLKRAGRRGGFAQPDQQGKGSGKTCRSGR